MGFGTVLQVKSCTEETDPSGLRITRATRAVGVDPVPAPPVLTTAVGRHCGTIVLTPGRLPQVRCLRATRCWPSPSDAWHHAAWLLGRHAIRGATLLSGQQRVGSNFRNVMTPDISVCPVSPADMAIGRVGLGRGAGIAPGPFPRPLAESAASRSVRRPPQALACRRCGWSGSPEGRGRRSASRAATRTAGR
jgi:hypothetical protein